MEFFYIGLGTSAVITISISVAAFFAFKQGYKAGLSVGLATKKETKEELDEKKLREIKRRQEGLENIMNYDYDKAIERRFK